MTQLTRNFSLAELIASQRAVARGINNTPGSAAAAELARLAKRLQAMRDRLGKPLRIASGYRGPQLNRAVGGASRSQHLYGRAVDISVAGHDRRDLVEAAIAAGMTGIGLGGTFLHVDIRPQRHVTVWEYSRGATAGWRPALGRDPVGTVKAMARLA